MGVVSLLAVLTLACADQQGNSEHVAAGGAIHHLGHSQPEDCEGADLQAWIRQGETFMQSSGSAGGSRSLHMQSLELWGPVCAR